jgi:hypothetical protein
MSKDNMQPAEQPSDVLQNMTVAELAMKHGHTFHRRGKDGKMYPTVPGHDSIFKRAHAIADVLHGWTKHERRVHQPVRLSGADYAAAISAAAKGQTHGPANMREEQAQ